MASGLQWSVTISFKRYGTIRIPCCDVLTASACTSHRQIIDKQTISKGGKDVGGGGERYSGFSRQNAQSAAACSQPRAVLRLQVEQQMRVSALVIVVGCYDGFCRRARWCSRDSRKGCS